MDAAWSTRASVSGEGRGGASAVGREGKGRCLSSGEGGEGYVRGVVNSIMNQAIG